MRSNATTLTALIVHPDEQQRDRLERTTRILGMEACHTATYIDGLRQLSWSVGLAIVAAELEEGRGLQLAELFRARRPRLAIILIGTEKPADALVCADLRSSFSEPQLLDAIKHARDLVGAT